MTREEAIRLLSGLMFKGKLKEALDMVIKALEQEPCEDAISRQAVLGLFAQNADAVSPYSKTWEEVKVLPTVTPQPEMGYWEWKPHPVLPYTGNWYCSKCHIIGSTIYNYCPNCGRKMQELQESEDKG